ncbi:MAG TPA: hypothetical protein VL328_13125 [Gemmatimonadaceae bacterium]|jgi:hypothetical protein|nr:hypothetical protein [Gemmatimonadaceae bacterium]
MTDPMIDSASSPQGLAGKRVASVVAVGVVFLALGVLDLWRGVAPLFGGARHLAGDDLLVLAIGIAALVGGTFVIRGRNWARWLLAAWMLLHVVISVGHPGALAAHVAIFGFIAFLLFRPAASAHFTSS